MERLIKEGVLLDLDFSNFDVYMDCVKGKLTVKTRKEKRAKKETILELIHTNVCGPISPNAMGGFKYFVTFIDDYSRFGKVKLISKKSKVLDAFKKFKDAIELKLGKLIKCVHSNKGGEFYGQYDGTSKNLGPFAKYL